MGQKIGGQTGDFAIYVDGDNLLGIAEVKLPEVKFKTQTINGGGIVGDIEFTNHYAVESLEAEVKFNTVSAPAFKLMDLSGKLLEMKAAIIEADGTTHILSQTGFRVAMKGQSKSVDLGTVKLNELLGTSFKFEATYLECWLNGQSLYKVDKFNGIVEQMGVSLIKKLSDLF